MDMAGSNLILGAALDRGRDDPKLTNSSERMDGSRVAHEMDDASEFLRHITTLKAAAVAGLVSAFLGILFAVAAVTDAPDETTTAGLPAPQPAPTAVIDDQDQNRPVLPRDVPEPAG